MTLDAYDKMMSEQEMTIPKSRSETVIEGVLTSIVVVFFAIGVWNLTSRVALIPSIIWLVFVAAIVWNGYREAGSLRRYLADRAAVFAGRTFVLCPSDDAYPPRIRFGYELFGCHVFQRDVQIDRIESVVWTPGQATDMAGHDMKDWHVVLWFDHCNPEKSKKDHMLHKPDQDPHIVGPSRRKEDTSTLGLEFVAFLRKAGACLTQGESNNIFIREVSKKKNAEEEHPIE